MKSFSNFSLALLSILSILAPQIYSFPAIPGTLQDDGNSILNQGLDPNIFHHIGTYSPRYTVKQDSPQPPIGCSVEMIDSLERHGARYMTSNALTTAQKTLTKVQNALKQSKHVSPEFQFLLGYTLSNETSDLAPYGALQAWYSGRSTASNYPLLTRVPPFVRATGDESSLNDRVIITAKYWRWGFEGKDFPSGILTNGVQVRNASSQFPSPDVTFTELAGYNDTLDVQTCNNYNNYPSIQGEKGAINNFTVSTILPTFGKDLQNQFIQSGAPSTFNLTATDILNLAELCSFETLARANVTNGQLQLKQSQFCNLFNASDWPTIDYALNYGKWQGYGYGSPFYKALGTGFLRELVARLTNKSPPLQPPTSLNTTLDGSSSTFPLPNQIKGPVVYFDGSHDNQIAPIAASANLFNGPALSSAYNAQLQPYNWYFSQIAPLQGKIVFEKLSCLPFGQQYVRIRANEAILDPSKYCTNGSDSQNIVGQNIYNSLCPLDTFITNLNFVESDDEWNKCYS